MSKLLTFLENNCKLTLENESGSKYFEYGFTRIRVSDHIAPISTTLMLNTITILLPKNSRKHYILVLHGEIHIYESFTKLKVFFENMFLFINTLDYNTKIKQPKSDKNLNKKVIELNEKLNYLKQKSFLLDDFTAGQQKQIKLWKAQC